MRDDLASWIYREDPTRCHICEIHCRLIVPRFEGISRGTTFAPPGTMDELKREMLVNHFLEHAAALSYYLLFALVPALLVAVWLT